MLMLFIENRAPRAESSLLASLRVDTTKTWTILASEAFADPNIPVAPVTSTPMLHPARPNERTANARTADSFPAALSPTGADGATKTFCIALKSTRSVPMELRGAGPELDELKPSTAQKKPHRNH